MSKDQNSFVELYEDKEIIESIAEDTAKYLDVQRGYEIDGAVSIPTIFHDFMVFAWKKLSSLQKEGKTPQINLAGIMTIGISERENEDGEKEGNLMPFITVGQIPKTIIKSDDETEDD